MENKYGSRKFFIAFFFSVTSTVALFADKMDDGVYMAIATAILGLYSAANVMAKGKDKDNT